MILLDTNVISEPLRFAPEPRVVEWLDAQLLETLFLSVVTVAEMRFGVARLPNSRRRNSLSKQLETQVLPAFAGRVLNFDLAATQAYADLMAPDDQGTGHRSSHRDGGRNDCRHCKGQRYDGGHAGRKPVQRSGCVCYRSGDDNLKKDPL